MANYECCVRSNYFHIEDGKTDEFLALMSRVYGKEDKVYLWEEKDAFGKPVYGFGSEGAIAGVRNAKEDEDDDVDESAYDEFISGLQNCLAPDDAIIIMEAGHEKLRYVSGMAEVITKAEVRYINMVDAAKKAAVAMLGDPYWATVCEY